jgi:hypothetical protein
MNRRAALTALALVLGAEAAGKVANLALPELDVHDTYLLWCCTGCDGKTADDLEVSDETWARLPGLLDRGFIAAIDIKSDHPDLYAQGWPPVTYGATAAGQAVILRMGYSLRGTGEDA